LLSVVEVTAAGYGFYNWGGSLGSKDFLSAVEVTAAGYGFYWKGGLCQLGIEGKRTWGGRGVVWYCSGVGSCTGEGWGRGGAFGGKTSWGVLFRSTGRLGEGMGCLARNSGKGYCLGG
nr:hypothetical protein [Tanacetum cinerariifolium]